MRQAITCGEERHTGQRRIKLSRMGPLQHFSFLSTQIMGWVSPVLHRPSSFSTKTIVDTALRLHVCTVETNQALDIVYAELTVTLDPVEWMNSVPELESGGRLGETKLSHTLYSPLEYHCILWCADAGGSESGQREGKIRGESGDSCKQ